MSLNETVSAERVHIGFFGMRNAGKSSLVNAVTGVNVSVVSDVKGTTTDPVRKAMELLPLGPVLIIDTPGIDDEGTLGGMRVERTRRTLAETDIAVLVIDATEGVTSDVKSLEGEIKKRGIPYLKVYNKSDLLEVSEKKTDDVIYASAKTGDGIAEIKAALGKFAESAKKVRPIVSDIISHGDTVILVTPIDEAAPKGRIILPQQLVLRDVLDCHARAIVCQPEELTETISLLKDPPRLVITDSQVFGRVAKDLPKEIPLTSFSIIMARYKGELGALTEGFKALSEVKTGDKVLISEGCTHHRQCGDIGSVKLPAWIKEYTHSEPEFHFTSGRDFPENLSEYKIIVHCGGCMLNEAEMKHRLTVAKEAGVPTVNYGIAIAGMKGILERSIRPFSEAIQ